MLVLITYDVNSSTKEGQIRLRKVAKLCENNGVRVQNSVFECILDHSQYLVLKNELSNIIQPETDSLRFYILGNKFENKVEHIGSKESLKVNMPLIY